MKVEISYELCEFKPYKGHLISRCIVRFGFLVEVTVAVVVDMASNIQLTLPEHVGGGQFVLERIKAKVVHALQQREAQATTGVQSSDAVPVPAAIAASTAPRGCGCADPLDALCEHERNPALQEG